MDGSKHVTRARASEGTMGGEGDNALTSTQRQDGWDVIRTRGAVSRKHQPSEDSRIKSRPEMIMSQGRVPGREAGQSKPGELGFVILAKRSTQLLTVDQGCLSDAHSLPR